MDCVVWRLIGLDGDFYFYGSIVSDFPKISITGASEVAL